MEKLQLAMIYKCRYRQQYSKTSLGARAFQLTLWKASTLVSAGRTRAEITKFRQNIQAIKFPDVESDEALNGNGVVQLAAAPSSGLQSDLTHTGVLDGRA